MSEYEIGKDMQELKSRIAALESRVHPGYSRAVIPHVSYMAHLAGTGDTPWINQPLQLGTTGETRGMQSLMLRVSGGDFGIRGRCRLSDVGFLNWVPEGQWIGQRGAGHHLEMIQLELTGKLASSYDIFYRAHFSSTGWSRTVVNGSELGVAGERIEAIEAFVLAKL